MTELIDGTPQAAASPTAPIVPTTDVDLASLPGILDIVPSRVMIADRDFTITYVNDGTREGLLRLADWLPVAPEQIIGANLDIFHKNPSYQRAILADPGLLPRRANIEVGPETLDLQVHAIFDHDGQYVGAMATWENITDKLRAERELAETLDDSAALTGILADLTTAETLEKAIVQALDGVRSAFGWAYGSFWKIDAAGERLSFGHESGEPGAEFRRATHGATYTRGIGLAGRAWAADDLVFLDDLAKTPDSVRASVASQVGIHSGVAFPITLDGRLLGVMDFVTTDRLSLSAGRTEALRRLSKMLSAAFSRIAAAERELIETQDDSVAVNTVLASVTDATTVEEATQRALDGVRQSFGWVYGSFWRIDPADNKLKYVCETGDAGPEFRRVTLDASFAHGVGLSGRTWAQRDLYFTEDIGQMTDCVRAPVAQKVGVRSAVCFPITVAGEVVGTMDFFTLETLHPTQNRLDALRNVGRLVSAAVERIAKEEAARAEAEDLAAKVAQVLEVVKAASEGDLTRTLSLEGDDVVAQLSGGLERLIATFRASMVDIERASRALELSSEQLTILARGMGDGAATTSDRAASASAASEEVSVSIQTVASAAEEMTASIREIAQNATEASTVATTAVETASSAQQTVSSLGDSSQEIGQVIKVITSIAQQTNLLALNATIEAARAGDAGKGFAVVANEVKELAKETAKATEDIGRKIEAIQGDTQGAVTAISEISEVIGRINDIQTTIASAVEEQTATTNEIARSVTEAATGAGGIAEDVTRVATAAGETAEGAQNTLQAATELGELSITLKDLISRFTI
ncbi:methyl-accepting chemotaxis protein [Nocardioides sp. TRM66260-LWL]|uniref:GAF domain-containing protein n=1 Tax=Nocardioides sp. TRM66260-LWL TaxID=2874478 RepID=UPI001CC63C0B|nr:methyl-accepting chemotaxis protein [Nocardioides sp. TRM66260-LWL]MBZ5736160.1 methyl-accepting chemotaxis protein [Nocardioides sp. TRM66260-LWL]